MAVVEVLEGEVTTHRPGLPSWTVAAAATVTVLARVPFIGRAPSPDEAGFLLVGSQWGGPGPSLYGHYFVDRPPLLVTIFRAAAWAGGVPALRLVGCAAAVAVVVGCASAARQVGGPGAGRWAALTAAALVTSPLMGGFAVNGELLAAPFVVAGLVAVVRSLDAPDDRSGARWMLVAGSTATCAVLVKQNFADVAVVGVVALVVSTLRGELSSRRSLGSLVAATLGAASTLAVVSVWTVLHGTSLRGVLDAMYPFRVRAGRVIAASDGVHADVRLERLVHAATSSGLLVLMVLAVVAVCGGLVHGARISTPVWALVALMVFDAASVLSGGSFWHHYLVQMVVPVAVLSGLLASRRRVLARPVVVLVVVAAATAWALSLGSPDGSDGRTVGRAVAAAARPGDTVVNLYGHPDVVLASGLSSPYRQLWSLPTKTLDPRLTDLDGVLEGPRAPTWVVTGRTVRSWGLRTTRTQRIIEREYRPVATVCGRVVRLRDGVDRPAPPSSTTCRAWSDHPTTHDEGHHRVDG